MAGKVAVKEEDGDFDEARRHDIHNLKDVYNLEFGNGYG